MPSVTRKCRALLAYLAPRPGLSPAAPTLSNSCPVDLATEQIPLYGSHSPSICALTNIHPELRCCSTAEAKTPVSYPVPRLIVPPVSSSSPLSHDVDQLLHICLDRPDDLKKQTSALDALCTLCSTTLRAADICVDLGSIEIMLKMLNSIPQSRHTQLFPSPFVEKNEKALHLLHLIIASSEAGCGVALGQSSSIITTLGKKLLRVSDACTTFAIEILLTLCSHSEAAVFCQAVSETAIKSKLVVVLQVAADDSTKRRAGRLLRLLAEIDNTDRTRKFGHSRLGDQKEGRFFSSLAEVSTLPTGTRHPPLL